MHSVEFQLEPSTSTPYGGACADYLQAPGCGFLCGSINFSCEFVNLSETRTELNDMYKWPILSYVKKTNTNTLTNQITESNDETMFHVVYMP
jgi:hypothetical protein